MNKTLTKEDLVKLEEIDEGIVAFIVYVRDRMQWQEKRLDSTEMEVMFGMLNKEHQKIIDGLRRIID